jgi:nucleoside-diphosphate-sugar epimerase
MKENPANENTQLNPHSFYGETKAMAEKLVLGKGGVVIRSPPIFGPGFNEGFGFVIAQIEKSKMQIVGDGNNRINWIHINDLIDALLLAKNGGKAGEVYLIAGREIKTQAELFALLAKHLGVEPPEKRISKQLATAFAYYKMFYAKAKGRKPKVVPEHIRRITDNRTFDISKAREELGFAPKIGYDEAAKEMVEEYLKGKENTKA